MCGTAPTRLWGSRSFTAIARSFHTALQTHAMNATMLDSVNQAWYAAPGSVAGMAMRQGFIDEGERAAYAHLVDGTPHRRILDLGVGPGRTVPLLRSIGEDYVGIDYLAPMVEAARARHPTADIRLGDARDLGQFATGCRDLVAFSYHGIDSVGHDDRRRILDEVLRVLVPGGVFWFSTLNLAGPAARYRPWRPVAQAPAEPDARWTRAAMARARGLARIPVHTMRYWRGRLLAEAGAEWSVAPFFAGGWLLMAHYVSLRELLRELTSAGFEPHPEVFGDAHGRRLAPADDLRGVFGFNVLAHKP